MKKYLLFLMVVFAITPLLAFNFTHELVRGEKQLSELNYNVITLLQDDNDTTRVGTLEFWVLQADAQVVLSQNSKIVQTWNGPKILDSLQVGEYELLVTKDLYNTVTKKIIIEANKTKIENVTLLRVDKSDIDETPISEINDGGYTFYEVLTSFPQGSDRLKNLISSNLVYPNFAKLVRVEGKVLVQFVVEPNGEITNVSVLHGVGYGCDQEAVRIVKLLPNMKPGERRMGKFSKFKVSIPIVFKLP